MGKMIKRLRGKKEYPAALKYLTLFVLLIFKIFLSSLIEILVLIRLCVRFLRNISDILRFAFLTNNELCWSLLLDVMCYSDTCSI